MQPACFWALLTLNDLVLLYSSAIPHHSTSLSHRSLYDVFHPDEVTLARRDFTRFMDTMTLNGSITRCRLRNLQDWSTPAYNSSSWMVVDLTMYIVSDQCVLAFFHTHPMAGHHMCGVETYDNNMIHHLKKNLHQTLHSRIPFSSRSRHLTILYKNLQQTLWTSSHHPLDPTLLKDITSYQHSSMQNTSIKRLYTKSHVVDRLVIHYGCLVFISIDSPNTQSSLSSRTVDRPSHQNVQVEKSDKDTLPSAQGFLSPWSEPLVDPRYGKAPERLLPSMSTGFPTVSSLSTGLLNTEKRLMTQRTSAQGSNETNSAIPYARKAHSPSNQDIPAQPSVFVRRCRSLLTSSKGTNAFLRSHSSCTPHFCESCGTDSSPEWRRGPSGHKTVPERCFL
ncbi:uncharacterized protein BYT42DRAFT_582766 [Radiomyces spectabilis]|uniref:uncharacterized protein n=1 Tax=Radiomyces spectabilis TaxID=64574 RepID=UPI00221F292F|nr:uncharacterized protein BYT42DRAFT_582766 [Radiomyces spectabilis]KAI8370534.1 hypothetical protein BYT42DRAFT_582766 [Radiomyces spectabilis]